MSSRRFRESSSNFLSSCGTACLSRISSPAAFLDKPAHRHAGPPCREVWDRAVFVVLELASAAPPSRVKAASYISHHGSLRPGTLANKSCCFDGNLNRTVGRIPSCLHLQTLSPTSKANKHRTTENSRKTLSHESLCCHCLQVALGEQ